MVSIFGLVAIVGLLFDYVCVYLLGIVGGSWVGCCFRFCCLVGCVGLL